MQLKLDNISKTDYESDLIIKTTFELNNGLHGLLGANGSGKTTIIRIICGLLNPDTGHVFYNTQNILSMYKQYKQVLGYLPQNFGFYPDLTVKDYLLYMSTLKAIRPIVAKMKIDYLSEKMNFKNLLNTKMGSLSGGNIKRIGIAQALLNDPEILILDEPTINLDPSERMKFNIFLRELSKDKIIIISSHIVSDFEFGVDDLLLITSRKDIIKSSVTKLLDDFPVKIYQFVTNNKTPFQTKPDILIQNCNNEYLVKCFGDEIENSQIIQPTLEDVFFYYSKSGLYR